MKGCMGIYSQALAESKVQDRKLSSDEIAGKVSQKLTAAITVEKLPQVDAISIFCAGSTARNEAGTNSDLDLFILHKQKRSSEKLSIENAPTGLSRLDEFVLYSELIRINSELGLPEFSNDGEFLRVYSVSDMSRVIGMTRDDHDNLFTARILLLLESRVLFNEPLYRSAIDEICSVYFRDDKVGNTPFRPYFLLNDLLRYWRTVCLNYETSRYSRTKSWRKKNFNLKYSRLLTVYSTVLAIAISPSINRTTFADLISKTPLQRLALALDSINDDSLLSKFKELLDQYEYFLEAKDNKSFESELPPHMKEKLNQNAETFSDFFQLCINHPAVPKHMQKVILL